MTSATHDELRRLVAEALGTASLLAAIVGSGIVVAQGGDPPATTTRPGLAMAAAGGAATAGLLVVHLRAHPLRWRPCGRRRRRGQRPEQR